MLRKIMRRHSVVAIWFLAPSAFGFLVFYLIPFAMGVWYSFMDRPNDGSFVGFANYKELLASDSFRKAAKNTFLFTSVSVPITIAISLLLALLLNQSIYFRNWLRTAYVLPLVVPVASVVLIWQVLFDWNGAVNSWLHEFNLSRIDWMKSEWARGVLSVVYAWKNMGYNLILFLAGLQNIPKDYYETADLEGASSFHKLIRITLVYLTPTLFFVVLMGLISSFRIFRETYLIAGDYPHDSIYMLQHYMNNMFLALDIQKLTSAASVMVVCLLVLVSGMFALERRFTKDLD
ncbi:carbohydrate ABC transporter permease [Paenibacillus sp. OV219]|uniref:carbohydrate ABC transporter permease n=1 Tax=Paenibacillus sp. OV219 TaxID=1884377 RepID=UPI0008D76F15|nr:sugar ABC transporter permease [Paenibacillus sp. OV219]SEM55419.1 carbohydrate ABC transporter membrane protein 1, CUT1 family [Paenibacillus sp. OV219]